MGQEFPEEAKMELIKCFHPAFFGPDAACYKELSKELFRGLSSPGSDHAAKGAPRCLTNMLCAWGQAVVVIQKGIMGGEAQSI